MNVVFVYPRWDYPTFGKLQEPLGISHVAAALAGDGHEVRMIDLTFDPIEEVDAALDWAHMVGISSSTALFGRAARVLDRIKQARPEIPVVLGGPHGTALPEESLARGFDAVVIGEGERSAVDLVRAMEKGDFPGDVPGVAARKEDKVVFGPERPFEPDLDDLPDPDRSLIKYDEYFKRDLTQIGVVATRGCPFNCLFCKPMQDKIFGRKIRRRSVRRIASEMASIKRDYGINSFLFRDDTMALAGREWFVDFEREMAGQGLESATFSCQARVDQVDAPLIGQMIRCGLRGLAFGVESGSQKVLDFYRKNIKVEQTIAAFDLCRQMGVGTHAFLMLGAPEETREELEMTVRLVERIRPNSVSIAVTTPAPGTALFDKVIEMGAYNIENPEDSDYLYNLQPIRLAHLTRRDLAETEKRILELVPGTYFKEDMERRAKCLEGD